MTTLALYRVATTRYNTILISISGDLSYSYSVKVPGKGNSDLRFTTLNTALKFARRTGKLGWSKQIAAYDKKFRKRSMKFGFVRGKLARKYAPIAYGDYAARIRKKYKLKKR